MEHCPFCMSDPADHLLANDLAFALPDRYPVTPMHTLIIPKRHTESCFTLTIDEVIACRALILELQQLIQRRDRTVSAFNIGINIGRDAGQTISHCHIHLIPRRTGDVENPRGGVRHVIAAKGSYPGTELPDHDNPSPTEGSSI